MAESIGSRILDSVAGVGPRRLARREAEISAAGGEGFKFHLELGSAGFGLQVSPNFRWADKRSQRRWVFLGLNPKQLDEFEVRENWRCGGMDFGRVVYTGKDAGQAEDLANLAYESIQKNFTANPAGKFHFDADGPAMFNNDKENISVEEALAWKFDRAEVVRAAAFYQAMPIQDLATAIILDKAKAPLSSQVLLEVQLDALQRLERQPGESVLEYQDRWGASDLSALLMEKSVQGLSASGGRRQSAFQAVIKEGQTGRTI